MKSISRRWFRSKTPSASCWATRALGLLITLCWGQAIAQNLVEITGFVEMKSKDCLSPELHNHPLTYFVVDDETNQQIQLTGDQAVLQTLSPDQRILVTGVEATQVAGAMGGGESFFAPARPQIEVQDIELLAMPEAAEEEGVPDIEGAHTTQMLSCLLVFVSTNTHGCMTSVTNARNLMFDNTNNANLGMQAITKGKYGLQLGNGTGVPEDHILELTLNVNSADHDSDSIESLALAALPGEGYNRYSYNRVLIFAPDGITDKGFTAYAYFGSISSAGTGRVSVYGKSYGNNRMNGYLHELGHNFGFHHSTKGGSEYGDRTCVMGLSNDSTKTETYNAAKLLESDWLDIFPDSTEALTTDMTLNIYPLSSDPTVLNEVIAVSIPGTDYYVSYHRDDRPYGYLSQSGDRDKVFVHTKPGGSYQKSNQAANLSVGGSYAGPGSIVFDRYGPNNDYATVSIDIADGNTKPVADAQSVRTDVNVNLAITLTGSDDAGDNDGNAPLVFEVVEGPDPAKGSLTGTAPNLTYVPVTDFAGEDSFVFSVYDGLIKSFATVDVAVYSNTNAPDVNAGVDISASASPGSTVVNLNGSVTDLDGPDGGPVTSVWSVVSGPGSVDFADSTAPVTTATFSQLGTYVLRLTATDPDFQSSDDVTVTISVADTDADGLPDSWELFFFGDLSQGPAGNPDGDGQDNGTEFSNGSDPTMDESSPSSIARYVSYTATQLDGASTNLNQSTATNIDWQAAASQSPLLNLGSGGVIEVMRSGDYFISLTLPMSSGVQRSTVQAQAYVNGVEVPGLLGESSYIRSNSGHAESSSHFAGMLSGVGAGDWVEIKVLGTAASGTVTMSTARLYIEYLQPSRTVFASLSDGPAGGNLNPASAEPLFWAAPQRKDLGFTHADGTAGVMLENNGTYLVTVNMPIYSNVQRPSPRVLVELDGSQVLSGSGTQGYIRRDGGHNDASVHWAGLVQASAGSVLTVSVIEEGASGTVSLPTGEKVTLFIEALDVSTGTYFGSGTALDTGDNWNTTGNVSFSSNLILDGSAYSKPTAHEVQVTEAGDYLLMYHDALTSTVQRASPKMTVQVNGSPVAGAETKSHYIRSDSGHNESSGSLVTLLSLSANDIVRIGVEAEAASGTVDDAYPAILALIRRSAPPNPDGDNDGMDDAWELATFGTTSGDGSGDIDANGITDYFQFIYGDVDGVYTGFSFVAEPTPSSNGVTYTWTVQSDFVLGTDYILEASTDMGNPASWTPITLDGEDSLVPTVDGANNKTQWDLTLDDDLGSPVYLRFRNP